MVTLADRFHGRLRPLPAPWEYVKKLSQLVDRLGYHPPLSPMNSNFGTGAADGLVADRAVAAVIFQWSKFFVKCSSGGASVVEMLVQVDRELVQQGVAGPLAALPPIHRHCLSRRTLLSTAKADSTEYSQDGNAR